MDEIMLNKIKRGDGFEVESLPLADLVHSIKRALFFKQDELLEHGLVIKNIQLTLKSIATYDAGVNISLQIPILGKIKFGSEISEKSLQTTILTLKQPIKGRIQPRTKLMEMEETLVQSITSIIEGLKAASSAENNSIPLDMESASAEFNFVLSGDSKISMIIESGFESELSNTLKIKFEKNSKKNLKNRKIVKMSMFN